MFLLIYYAMKHMLQPLTGVLVFLLNLQKLLIFIIWEIQPKIYTVRHKLSIAAIVSLKNEGSFLVMNIFLFYLLE